ncbi:MAG: ABC transporter ATP-binding protein [Halanaerobiales bacterium]
MNKYTFTAFIKKYKWRYLLGIIWLIMVDILQLVIPRLLGNFTDNLEQGVLDRQGIWRYVFLIIMVALGTAVFRFLWRLFINGTSRLLEKEFREDFYRHLQSLSTNYYNQNKTGDLMAHATNDINAVRNALGPGIVMLADAVFLTVATIGLLLFTIDYRLTLLALIPLPFLTLLSTKFGKIIHRKFRRVQKAFSHLTDKVQENFSGIRVVKAFALEEDEVDRFAEANKHNREQNIDLIKSWGLFGPLVQFISGLSFVIVLWYGGILVIRGVISLGEFVAFNSYLGMLTWPMMAVGFVINILQRGSASLERLNLIFSEKPEITDSSFIRNIEELKGEIEFNNLSFRFNQKEEYVLKNINLKINAGETAAIIGRTGSGKSTLVNLLLRLYDPEPDTLFIDGYPITEIPLKVLREEIGYVPQDNFLFSTDIEKNIAFADPELSRDKVKKAAKDAQIYDNIVEFPDSFSTILGERGVTLSGGQKQRISIARALIKKPKILILDDSLSAVDTKTEEKILKNLQQIMTDRTCIIISHRISTIKNADKIFVIDEGEIIERGDHATLLKKQGLYYQLYQKQLLEEKLAGEERNYE